jgi:hypothetical protein
MKAVGSARAMLQVKSTQRHAVTTSHSPWHPRTWRHSIMIRYIWHPSLAAQGNIVRSRERGNLAAAAQEKVAS